MENTVIQEKIPGRTLYKFGIILVFLVALAHIGYTFYAFKTLEEPALWFFSGALVMLLTVMLNYINLKISHQLIFRLCLTANLGASLFCWVLGWPVPEGQTLAVAVVLPFSTFTGLIYQNGRMSG
jgi:uncharacterized membrane protein YjjP (DUF1212 family)